MSPQHAVSSSEGKVTPYRRWITLSASIMVGESFFLLFKGASFFSGGRRHMVLEGPGTYHSLGGSRTRSTEEGRRHVELAPSLLLPLPPLLALALSLTVLARLALIQLWCLVPTTPSATMRPNSPNSFVSRRPRSTRSSPPETSASTSRDPSGASS
jgi:hypothetical protein